jgi:hypothetical protein
MVRCYCFHDFESIGGFLVCRAGYGAFNCLRSSDELTNEFAAGFVGSNVGIVFGFLSPPNKHNFLQTVTSFLTTKLTHNRLRPAWPALMLYESLVRSKVDEQRLLSAGPC